MDRAGPSCQARTAARPATANCSRLGDWPLRHLGGGVRPSYPLRTFAAAYGANARSGVSTLGTNDVWGVGTSAGGGRSNRTLILHWDGTRWAVVPSPKVGYYSLLDSVSAVSRNDVWAVGGSSTGTLAEHWNGRRWTVAPTPTGKGCDPSRWSPPATSGRSARPAPVRPTCPPAWTRSSFTGTARPGSRCPARAPACPTRPPGVNDLRAVAAVSRPTSHGRLK